VKVAAASILNSDGIQRYRNTFVNFYTKGVKDGLVYVHSLNDATLVLICDKGMLTYDISTLKELNIEIEVVMPHTYWKQWGITAVCYQRKPARQFRRSLSDGTHELLCAADYIPKSKKHVIPDRYPSLHQNYVDQINNVVNQQPLSFTDGVKNLLSADHHAVAVGNKFLLGHEGTLILGTEKIAKFYFKQASYKVHPLFAEELRDLTRGHTFKAIEEVAYEFS